MTLTGKVYICSAGDTFDQIARALWGDESYAAELLAANPEHSTVAMFTGGEILYIPEVNVPTADELRIPQTAPWRAE